MNIQSVMFNAIIEIKSTPYLTALSLFSILYLRNLTAKQARLHHTHFASGQKHDRHTRACSKYTLLNILENEYYCDVTLVPCYQMPSLQMEK